MQLKLMLNSRQAKIYFCGEAFFDLISFFIFIFSKAPLSTVVGMVLKLPL